MCATRKYARKMAGCKRSGMYFSGQEIFENISNFSIIRTIPDIGKIQW